MPRLCDIPILCFLLGALLIGERKGICADEIPPAPAAPVTGNSVDDPSSSTSDVDVGNVQQSSFFESLTKGPAFSDRWIAPAAADSAKFPGASQIPGTEVWWKFGGFIKGDLIHDFEPVGSVDRFVPTTIPTNGQEGQNTLMQAKATRLNLDVRRPSEWGTARGFFEGDFFTGDATFRIRHAYAEVGPLIAGQTWTVFTDPAGIPNMLDFETPIAFLTLRQAQFRWTREIGEHLKWAVSVEDPTTSVDDSVTATIPGLPEQPIPDFATHLKYKTEILELFAAGLIRDVSYRPDGSSAQDRLGWATNFVGILHPTKNDKLIGQVVFGDGLGRYRSGNDLRLATPNTVDTIHHTGACVALTHQWSKKWHSTLAHSVAIRREEPLDPPDTPRLATYSAANLIWEPIPDTTMGIEYLYGTNETKDGSFGFANRIQLSVQYNFR
jgi:hypothetical protein